MTGGESADFIGGICFSYSVTHHESFNTIKRMGNFKKSIRLNVLMVIVVLIGAGLASHGSRADDLRPLVSVGEDGLEYRALGRGDRIPDFSNCGFRGGGVPLPSIQTAITLVPREGTDDDTHRIQAAIAQVASRPLTDDGFRGAVLLKAGTYRVAETLYLKESGVVLRGEGPAENATVIIATGTKKRTLIHINGGQPGSRIESSERAIADDYVPLGAKSFRLTSTKGLAVDDAIEVHRPATPAWLARLGTDRLNRGPEDQVKNWKPQEYSLNYERRIVRIDDDTITLDAPIVLAIDQAYGGGSVYKNTPDQRIRNVGIESLRLISEYQPGKENSDEAHAWDAIKIDNLVDGWVRDVTALHFGYSCVHIGHGGKHITVQDCEMIDPVSRISGGRRYSFALSGQLCLVQRCYARNGRHDFVMHARARGPNVFLDCVAEQAHSDSGPHHRWATGTLYDNVVCKELNVQWRGRSGTGHGWAGANTVFWNCTATSIDCQSPPTAHNFAIGCVGKIRGNGYIGSPNEFVQPLSLYRAQLQERLAR